jgi:hypothetical protein
MNPLEMTQENKLKEVFLDLFAGNDEAMQTLEEAL